MAIDGLIDDYVNRRVARGGGGDRAAAMSYAEIPRESTLRPGAGESNALSAAYQQLVKYIPTEVLSFYIPTVGYLQNATATDDRLLWAVVIFYAIISFLIVVGQSVRRLRRQGARLSAQTFPWYPALATILSYVAWASSMPGSILVKAVGGAAYVGPLAVIGVTVVLATSTYFIDTEATN